MDEVVDGLGEFDRFASHLQPTCLDLKIKVSRSTVNESGGCRREHVFASCVPGIANRPEPIPSC